MRAHKARTNTDKMKKPRKTEVKRNRECRARKRDLTSAIMEENQSTHEFSIINNVLSDSDVVSVANGNDKNSKSTESSTIDNSILDKVDVFNNDYNCHDECNNNKRARNNNNTVSISKTSAECAREYRARKNPMKMKKTPIIIAEGSRECRRRKINLDADVMEENRCKKRYINYNSRMQENMSGKKLHRMSLIDNKDLSYETVFEKNKFYMIASNIDTIDGLANGAVGKLMHIERDKTDAVKAIWFDFPRTPVISHKIKKNIAEEMMTNCMNKSTNGLIETVPHNNNVNRTHVPLEYNKENSQSILYVTLSHLANPS